MGEALLRLGVPYRFVAVTRASYDHTQFPPMLWIGSVLQDKLGAALGTARGQWLVHLKVGFGGLHEFIYYATQLLYVLAHT